MYGNHIILQARWILLPTISGAIGNAFSASFIGVPTCIWVSQSVYPYHFEELTYQQNIDALKIRPK